MIVAIHQPNFLPWLGLFHKLASCDLFIGLDHVQALNGPSWLTRNRLLIGGQARWFTLPTFRTGRLGQAITDVEIDYGRDIVRTHSRTLEQNYGGCPEARPYLDFLATLYGARHRTVATFNRCFSEQVARDLGLTTPIVQSSALVAADPGLAALRGGDLLIALCRAVGADTYLSGTGGLDYIEPAAFERAGLTLRYQMFDHPAYPQRRTRTFVSHLSILDALCQVGTPGVRRLLEIAS